MTSLRRFFAPGLTASRTALLPNRFSRSRDSARIQFGRRIVVVVIAVNEFIAAASPAPPLREQPRRRYGCNSRDRYIGGTRFGIGMDTDALLACGVPGTPLTWMDVRIGERAITPRIGKPVEVQALWINAFALGGRTISRDGEAGASVVRLVSGMPTPPASTTSSMRITSQAASTAVSVRNQIFAVGGLPDAIVENDRAVSIVKVVERELLTPMGLRTLARGDPSYQRPIRSGVSGRDAAYHQGTVWPWLIGPFVDAWLRVHGDDAAQCEAARRRFLAPLLDHLAVAGLGHVSEIADGDAPHAPRGCPFQAWSLGELIRSLARTRAPTVVD
jgi:glycogen debranching enzyme